MWARTKLRSATSRRAELRDRTIPPRIKLFDLIGHQRRRRSARPEVRRQREMLLDLAEDALDPEQRRAQPVAARIQGEHRRVFPQETCAAAIDAGLAERNTVKPDRQAGVPVRHNAEVLIRSSKATQELTILDTLPD